MSVLVTGATGFLGRHFVIGMTTPFNIEQSSSRWSELTIGYANASVFLGGESIEVGTHELLKRTQRDLDLGVVQLQSRQIAFINAGRHRWISEVTVIP